MKSLSKMPGFIQVPVMFMRNHSTTIMSFAAVGGVALTAVLAYKMAPKIKKAKEETKEELKKAEEENEPKKDDTETKEVKSEKEKKEQYRTIKVKGALKVAKAAAPVVVSAVVTSGLILGANSINLKRIAIATGAYEVATGDLKKYKEKLAEIVGEKKAEEVQTAVANDNVAAAWTDDVRIYPTGKGNMVFFDHPCGRFFRSSQYAVDSAFAEINNMLSDRMNQYKGTYGCDTAVVMANELSDLLGLPDAGCLDGKCFRSSFGRVKPTYSYTLSPAGEHAIQIDYDVELFTSDDARCMNL